MIILKGIDMAAGYRWIITRDHLAEPGTTQGTNQNAVGVVGPHDASEEITDNEAEFKIFDSDGELYYTGKLFGEYEGFEPLDDYGRPNAGASEIHINGKSL
jgi:hypothetical protein